MIINTHILKLVNVYYFNNKFNINSVENKPLKFDDFIDNYSIINCETTIDNNLYENKKIIDNMFIVDTLHSCFSHALIDSIFPYYWAINDIRNIDKNFRDFTVFIRKKNVLKFHKQNLPLIDSNKSKYKGTWNDLLNLVSENVLFEHLIDNKSIFFIKNCYFYIKNDKWQRSPWNCLNYYPGRNVNINDVIFNDNVIYNRLKDFVEYTKNKYNISKTNIINKHETIIIERKENRFWNKNIIKKIIENINKNSSVKFNGIKMLEELSFYQQIKLFSENNTFIFRHGSCLINLLWIPENSVIFDIDICSNRKEIVRRIAKLTNSKVLSILYNNIDYSKFVSF
jgi:hypothetical protein